MTEIDSTHGLFASLGGIIGMLLVKIISNNQKKFELNHGDASEIRKELKIRCDKLQIENDELKEKYYSDIVSLKEELYRLRFQVTALQTQLTDIKGRDWVPPDEVERYQ